MFFFFGITALEYVLLMFCIELCYSVGGVDNLDLMSLMVVGIIEIEKNSGIGVFLWILQKFVGHLLNRTL